MAAMLVAMHTTRSFVIIQGICTENAPCSF